jgi:hypothetical protein
MALIPIFFSYNQKHIENMLNFGNCATINSSRNQKNVFRYIMTYYNRERIYTANPSGLAPAMYRQAARGLAA